MVKDNVFRLQNLDLNNSRSAFKINTDGVLLAAWTRAFLDSGSVLEIGTGTGVIACILKANKASLQISVIEPDLHSYEEAVTNFTQNGFDDIVAICMSVQEFIEQGTTMRFDCIVCNPPYFIDSTLPKDISLRKSKHNTSLSAEELAKACSRLSPVGGRVFLVVPYQDSAHWVEKFGSYSFELEKKLDVRGRENKPFIRSLLCLKRGMVSEKDKGVLTLFSDEHRSRTEDYDSLVGDLYLK